MKKSLFTVLTLITLTAINQKAEAKIRRVGYFGTPINGTDYADLQSAHNAASNGDSIYIFPGTYSANWSKKLIVLGYGYFLSGSGADSGYQVINGNMSVTINFYAGSDSTILQGLDGFTGIARADISGISIDYCNVTLGDIMGFTLANWKITRGYLSISAAYTSVYQNIYIANNVITASALVTAASSTGVFNNNIFTSTPNFNNGGYSLYNNIFLSTTSATNIANCIFDYNIAGNNAIPNNTPYDHNQTNVNLSSVFVGYPTQGTYSNDDRYALATGSPAIGAGNGGTDCGIFGGTNPYRLAGIPPIPSFYKLTAPTNMPTTNPYTITFSVRSNN